MWTECRLCSISEGSPEIVPRRRLQPRQKSTDSKFSDSPLVRRVKRRMILTDSENDNSIVIEKENTKKIQCLKDTPLKIDCSDNFTKKSLGPNTSVTSDDVANSNDGETASSSEDSEAATNSDDEANYPNEDEMVMSKATRMSIMGVRPKDLVGSDESDFILSSDEVSIFANQKHLFFDPINCFAQCVNFRNNVTSYF